MKKIIAILGAVGLTATGASALVSCGTANGSGEDGNTSNKINLNEHFSKLIKTLVHVHANSEILIKDSQKEEYEWLLPLLLINFGPEGEISENIATNEEEWNTLRNEINTNKNNEWNEYFDNVLKEGIWGQGDSDYYKIKDYNQTVKKDLKKAIEILKDESVYIISNETDEKIYIYSTNNDKFTSKFEWSIEE
ncbi:lipoprotein [Mesoplasma florum]|uniref:lipoprotein n=1 Tax=Mesoplasma florum TaxID=2151 RepID=UPI000BE24FC2|nr:lipoprotein [Mesoplasma florum]ATI73300.1 hypothetical protein CQZ69_01830 [Mesoplasma florum]AVN61701.1 hypothetical protein CG004_01830 [Mesoplasma florum]